MDIIPPHQFFNGSVISLLFSTGLVCVGLLKSGLALKRAIMLIAALAIVGVAFEMLGVATGFPYGNFSYGYVLGPKVLGVPLLVLFGWFPFVISSSVAAMQVAKNKLTRIIIGVTLLLLFDAVFDPIAVALGMWAWDEPGIYYGVPLVNFVGWVLSGTVGVAFTQRLVGKEDHSWSAVIHVPYLIMMIACFMSAVFFMFWIPALITTIMIIGYILLVLKNKKAV